MVFRALSHFGLVAAFASMKIFWFCRCNHPKCFTSLKARVSHFGVTAFLVIAVFGHCCFWSLLFLVIAVFGRWAIVANVDPNTISLGLNGIRAIVTVSVAASFDGRCRCCFLEA